MSIAELLEDMGYEGTMCFENPDYSRAIEGITTDGRLVYNYDKMVAQLMEDENMSEDDAMEFIDFNTIGSLNYSSEKLYPIVMYNMGLAFNAS